MTAPLLPPLRASLPIVQDLFLLVGADGRPALLGLSLEDLASEFVFSATDVVHMTLRGADWSAIRSAVTLSGAPMTQRVARRLMVEGQ